MLNELISRGDCANCKICCKFEPDELIDAPTFTKKQMQYIKDNINENLKFTKIDDIYKIQVPKEGKTTYNVGTIEGGTSVNTIAQEAQMLCEYRSDRKDGLEYMEKKFNEIFETHRKEYVDVKVELVGLRPCENLNEEQEKRRQDMIRIAQDISEELTGIRPDGISGSTDCNIPLSMGIPSICYGAVSGEGAHTREEYVVKASLKTGYQVAFASVLRYFERR